AERLVQRGEVLGVLTVPAGAGRDLLRGTAVELQLAVDGADGVIANQLLSKSEALARALNVKLSPLDGVAPPLEVRVWTRFNPSLKSAFFFVPGLTAYLLAIAAVLLTALAIAGEWERGSMEQLFASPVSGIEIILGKLLPYLALGCLQMLLVLAFGTWAFDVPILGSLPLLFLAGMLFLVGMLGQGLLISVVTRNQLVATQAGAFSSLLPSLLLSGFVFPIENMPRVLQWLSHVIPARYLVNALRGLMLKGVGLEAIWGDLVALTIFAVAVLGISTARFRRKLA
ncbi:MAG TPA: ABC transporter permease, partial [Myxococcales bacterium]|nr:ABC transporter permease [Myxococcales bacterium]